MKTAMDITLEMWRKAEEAATPTQMSLYAGPQAGEAVRAMADQFGLTNSDAYTIFATTVGDVVLKLVNPNELQQVLEERLPGLTQNLSVSLANAILDYAAPALQEQAPAPSASGPVINPPTVDQFTKPALQNEIDELENTVSHLEPLRTMSSDMHNHAPAEPTYQSSQDELLQRPPQQNTGPRWDTDTSQ